MSTFGREPWHALSPHLDHALELGEAERASWLASLRERDPRLAAELQALLDEHRALAEEHFLEGDAALPTSASCT